MKVLLVLVLLGVTFASRVAQIYSIEKAQIYFKEFVETYNKQYADRAERQRRFEIFKHNLEDINQKNLASDSAVFGITAFTDLTNQEFIDRFTGLKENALQKASSCQPSSTNSTSAPDTWNWKDKGVISKAKDQKNCGSCWAFSAIGNVEAYYAIKHKKNLDLSEQQLVDCDKNSGGCEGTQNMQYPFLYLKQSGSMQEQDYPYQAVSGKCQFDASKVKVQVSDCIIHTPKTEDDMKNIVYSSGPLSIAIDASAMQNYHHGVLQDCPLIVLNHAVLVVGYGTESGTPFWLIKNSWGEAFGEDGFVKIKRGVNACGLMQTPMVQAVVQ